MSDFLTPVITTAAKRENDSDKQDASPTSSGGGRGQAETITMQSPDDVLKILKSQPDIETVAKVLRNLTSTSKARGDFNLVTPSALSAQTVDALVSQTISDYWKAFIKSKKALAKDLCNCLRSANGLGAILSRLRPLIADCRQKRTVNNTRDASSHIEDLIDVLDNILLGDRTSIQVWLDIRKYSQNPTQEKLMWKEYVSQVATGRILGLVAEAEDVLKERETSRKPCWLSTGRDYASWLGRNIAVLMKASLSDTASLSAVIELCGKAMSLGYLDRIVAALLEFTVEQNTAILEVPLSTMKAYEQRKYFNEILKFAVDRYLGSSLNDDAREVVGPSPRVSAVAGLLHNLIKDNGLLRDHLVTTLTRSSIPALDGSLAARRSVIAALAAADEEKLHSVLEQSIKLFGDSFYIAHTPIMQQEALAQTLAITCGYVQRTQPMFLTVMAKSSYHTAGTSNRIGAASAKARLLGMVIGSAISRLVDAPELQLKFDLEGNDAAEAAWYENLTQLKDEVGNLRDLVSDDIHKTISRTIKSEQKRLLQKSTARIVPGGPTITEVPAPRIVEVLDDSENEDDDLMAYEKPDSDPEDDTDDPTEINRNKPTAPVYIRDLLVGLRDQENFDRHQLALATAAALIRRKANFGTEVTEHIEELASVLTSLNDNYDLPDFDIQRQQALIAVLLAQPSEMAQWFARAFFSGDYSITQRISMLTTMGLGARELAGLKDTSTEILLPPTPDFPSKKLPQNLHHIYTSERGAVARITGNLAKDMLSPLAVSAADQLTGPNILKMRTFSTRMDAEKRRSKPIPNALAKIVADNFFFPLTGRWWMATRSSSSSDGIYTSQHLLPPFLQTLALLMHASGQNTLALPQMTREIWELLLSIRTIAASDKGVLSALLFSFLMLLETNENKERIATEQAKELLETQQWVQMVFEKLGSGSEEDEKIRVLAAGVIVRCQEVVEKYQRRMAGSMMDY